MTVHHLKSWPEPFAAIRAGVKLYDIRKNDRDYAVGDVLRFEEWEPEHERYTGRSLSVRVTYMTRGGQWGLPLHLCVLGIAP